MVNENNFNNLSTDERIKKLAEMPDDEIDYSDIPDMSDARGWQRLYPNSTVDTNITDNIIFESLPKS